MTPDDLWLPDGDFTVTNRAFRQRYFGRAREELVIVTALGVKNQSRQAVLSKTRLVSAFDVHAEVTSRVSIQVNGHELFYDDLCETAGPIGCINFTVFDYWGDSLSALRADPDPLKTMSNPYAMGNMGPIDRPMVIGGLRMDQNGDVLGGESIKLWYYLDDSDSRRAAGETKYGVDDYTKDVLEVWETAFLKALKKMETVDGIVRVARKTQRSTGDEMREQQIDDLPVLIPAPIVAVVKMAIDLCSWRNRAHNRWLFALGALLSTTLAFPSALGLFSWLGVEFTPYDGYGFFILLAIALHHVKSLVHAFEATEQAHKAAMLSAGEAPDIQRMDPDAQNAVLRWRFRRAAAQAFPGIFTWTFVSVLVWIVLALCIPAVLPGVQLVSYMSLTATLFEHFFLLTLTLPLLAFDTRRMARAGAFDGGDDEPKLRIAEQFLTTRFYPFFLSARSLAARVFRTVVAAMLLGLLGVGIYGVTSWDPDFEEADMFRSDSYLRRFDELDTKYFGEVGPPLDVVVNAGLDYSDPAVGTEMLALTQSVLSNHKYVQGAPPTALCWYDAFLNYVNETAPQFNATGKLIDGRFPPPDMFYQPFFYGFLGDPQYAGVFGPAFAMSHMGTIETSRLQGFTTSLQTRDRQIGAVSSIHNTLSRFNDDADLVRARSFSPPFPIFRQFGLLRHWNRIVALVAIVVVVVMVALLVSLRVALPVLVVQVLVNLSLIGVLVRFKGWDLDQMVLPALMLIPSLVLDFTLPMAARLSPSLSTSSSVLGLDAFSTLGQTASPVLSTSVTFVVAACITAKWAKSPISQIFCQIVAFVFGVGALHVLLLFPVLLIGVSGCRKHSVAAKEDDAQQQLLA